MINVPALFFILIAADYIILIQCYPKEHENKNSLSLDLKELGIPSRSDG
jgi:hypothetical protein